MTQISPVGDNRKDLVTVFIDNVPYIGNPSAIGSEDLARVEVIKGPQSALFGKATFGGAISLITATPATNSRVASAPRRAPTATGAFPAHVGGADRRQTSSRVDSLRTSASSTATTQIRSAAASAHPNSATCRAR
jgi:outer membrane receptor protein involved in Fe transport